MNTRLQNEILNNEDRIRVVCAGRRTGKSMIVKKCVENFIKNKHRVGNTVIIICYSKAQAEIMFSSLTHEPIFNIKNMDRMICEANGEYVLVVSSDQYEKLRGYRMDNGLVIIDDAALVSKKDWNNINETLFSNGRNKKCKRIYLSTPTEQSSKISKHTNPFTRECIKASRRQGGRSLFKITSLDNGFMDVKMLICMKRILSQKQYNMEIKGEYC